jgi:hypothetical protein
MISTYTLEAETDIGTVELEIKYEFVPGMDATYEGPGFPSFITILNAGTINMSHKLEKKIEDLILEKLEG